MIRYFLLFLYTLSPMAVFAEGTWTTYINKSIDLYDICVEGDYIWCATQQNGAVQCDKNEMSFTAFTTADGLPSNNLLSVAVDRNGIKWFGTWKNGIVSYDGSSWTVYKPWETLYENWDTRYDNPVWEIYVDDTNVKWFGTQYGIYRHDDIEWEIMCKFGFGEFNKGIACDQNNIVWLPGYDELLKIDGDNCEKFDSIQSGSETISFEFISSVCIDLNNNIWIGFLLDYDYLLRYDGAEWMKIYMPDEYYISEIEVDKNNTLWFAVDYGILSFDGNEWKHHYDYSDDEWTDFITRINVDDDGTVWCAGSRGLWRYKNNSWLKYREENAIPYNSTGHITVDYKNRVWAKAMGSFFFFYGLRWDRLKDNSGKTMYPEGISAKDPITDAISFFDIEQFITTDEAGVTKYFPDKNYINGSTHIEDVAIDRTGIIWIATSSTGVFSFNGKQWNNYVQEDGLCSDRTTAITVDHNNVVWIGHYSEGITRYDGAFTQYRENNGLSDQHINVIFVDSNNCKWIGTGYTGVDRYDGSEWIHFSENDGLVSNKINSIEEDLNGVMWFGSYYGVSRYDGNTWKTYTEKDGLCYDRVNSIAIDHNNRKWFATSHGVSCFDDSDNPTIVSEFLPSKLTITGIYPNPFNTSTTIDFTLPHQSIVMLNIYSIQGQKVRELLSESLSSGKHSVVWDGKDDNGSKTSSGVYLVRFGGGNQSITRRVVYMK